jgi:hypothetical protein
MRTRTLLAAAFAFALLAPLGANAAAPGPLTFRISFDAAVRADPADGRVFVIVTKNPDFDPRFQVYVAGGVPFWGRDVSGMAAGDVVEVGDSSDVYGYPFAALDQLPAGDYTVQAFLNVYTTFHRADGSVVQLHMPCGDGGYFFDSPGNLFSTPVQMHLAPEAGTIDLALDQVVQPADPVPPGGTCQQGNPPDSTHVKHVKLQSDLLTAYWGTPIFIGANVLLPKGYDQAKNADLRYPVVYLQGHFPLDYLFGFVEGGGNRFSDWWLAKGTPRVIVVEFRHETPFFDDSYAVNSANLGPYGDAMVDELIPAIESEFRIAPRAWARTLTGGSTGGWEALAQQIFYPSFYGGTWGLCPDSLSFTSHQLVNIYSDENAYYTFYDWEQVPRPSARSVPGDTLWTMEQENHFELALGTHGRSQLGQWDIWQAVYGPQGADGYPAAIWDKQTGEIDHAVAEEWRSMDLTEYVRDHWSRLGPKLAGKLRVYVGDDDTFFLNNGVSAFQAMAEALRSPRAHAVFEYGKDAPHCWGPWGPRLVQMMADAMMQNAPTDADTSWWHEGNVEGVGPARISSVESYGRRGHGV